MICKNLVFYFFNNIKNATAWLSENEGFRVFYQFLVCLSVSLVIFNGLSKFTIIDYPLPFSLGRIADRILMACCFLQIAVLLYQQRYKVVLMAISVLVCGYLPYRYHGSGELYQLSILAIAFSGIKPKQALNVFLVSSGFIIALSTICFLGCFYENDVLFVAWNIGVRYSLGFNYPNVAGCVLLFFILSLWCRFRSLIGDLSIFVLLLGLIYLFHFIIKSRTSEYTAIIASIVVLYGYLRELLKEKLYFVKFIDRYLTANLVVVSFIVLLILFLSLSYYNDPSVEVFNKLDEILSTRLKLTHLAFSQFGFSVIGTEIPDLDIDTMGLRSVTARSYMYLDSLYAYLPIRLGVMPLIVYVLIHIIVVRNTYFTQNNRISSAMFLFAIHGFCEHMYLFAYINILPALYLSLMVNSEKKSEYHSTLETVSLPNVGSSEFITGKEEAINLLCSKTDNPNKKKVKKKY